MTLDELRQLRAASPEVYVSGVKRVVVDNDKPSAKGVWQNPGVGTCEMEIQVAGGSPGASAD